MAAAVVIPVPQRPRPRAGGLGPKQRRWCEKNIPAFKPAADAADKARATSDAERERLERAAAELAAAS